MKNKADFLEKYKGGTLFRIIAVLTSLFILLSLAFSIRFTASHGVNGLASMPDFLSKKFPGLSYTNLGIMCFAVVAVETMVFIWFILSFFRMTELFSDKKLLITSIILWCILIAGQLVIAFSLNITNNTDAFRVLNRGYGIASGRISGGDYIIPSFRRFSNNDFSVAISVWLFRFFIAVGMGQSVMKKVLVLMTMACIDLAIFFACESVRLFTGKNKRGTQLLLLCILNPLNYVLVQWVYTNTICIMPMFLMIYLYLRLEKKDRNTVLWKEIIYAVILGFIAACTYCIRVTAFFPVIAYAVYRLILLLRRQFSSRRLILFVCFAVSCLIFIKALSGASAVYNSDKSHNFPLIHWVKIGSYGEGRLSGDQIDELSELDSVPTVEGMKELETQRLKKAVSERGFIGNVKFYMKKTAITWSKAETDYNARVAITENSNASIYSWLVGDKKALIITLLYAYRITSFILSVIGICVLLRRKTGSLEQIVVYALFGGYLFYTFWEGKPCYCFPFLIFFNVPSLPAAELKTVTGQTRSRVSGILKDFRFSSAVTVICYILAVAGISYMTRNSVYEPSILAYTDNTLRAVLDNGEELTQEFYPGYDFNHITIRAVGADKKKLKNYNISIVSGDRTVVTNPDISIGNKEFSIHFDTISPDKNQKYMLVVRKKENARKGHDIKWVIHNTISFKGYKGKTYAGGKEFLGCLNMNVDREKRS